MSAFVFILSMQLLESRSNEAQKGEAEKLPLPGIAKTFSIPSEFHLCTSYTLSTSTFNRKRFLKPGTSGDNVRLDGTEAPETAETTSSPGQMFPLVFILCHVASCQPKYNDSLIMCWVLRKDNECAKFQNKVFHYRIYIINTEKLAKSADTCKQINIKPE